MQVGEGADEGFLGYWWCDHYRRKEEELYGPAFRAGRQPFWRKLFAYRFQKRLYFWKIFRFLTHGEAERAGL